MKKNNSAINVKQKMNLKELYKAYQASEDLDIKVAYGVLYKEKGGKKHLDFYTSTNKVVNNKRITCKLAYMLISRCVNIRKNTYPTIVKKEGIGTEEYGVFMFKKTQQVLDMFSIMYDVTINIKQPKTTKYYPEQIEIVSKNTKTTLGTFTLGVPVKDLDSLMNAVLLVFDYVTMHYGINADALNILKVELGWCDYAEE